MWTDNVPQSGEENYSGRYLFIVHVFREIFFTDVILAVTSVFERPAVIYDAISNEQHLASTMPVFSVFSRALGGKHYCKVITTVTERHDAVEAFLNALETAGVDFVEYNIGNALLVPIVKYISSADNE